MRYHEITESFFVSADQEREGVFKGCNAEASLGASSAEAYLEKYRPTDCLSRSQSLLLHPHPVARHRFCYRVTPLDDVGRYHTGWLALLADADPGQEGVIKHYAELFWKGAVCKEKLHDPWELRTSQVEIGNRVGGSSRDLLV